MKMALLQIEEYIDEHYWLPLYNQGGHVEEETVNDVAGNTGRADAMVDGNCCWSLFTSAHITYDGLMSACCFDHNGKWTMGDLRKQSFHECWHSKKFQNLRQRHIENKTENTPCASCLHRGKNESCSKTNETM